MKDLEPRGKQLLTKSPVFKGEKTIFEFLQNFLHNSLTFFLVLFKNEHV